MNERERAQHFYEMLTGVFDDEQSKIFRYICFGALFLGMLWAGWYYFRASILADTSRPLDPDMFADVQPRRDDSALKRIVDLAQTIDTMRSAGSTIAQALQGLNHMPFNLEPEGGRNNDNAPLAQTMSDSSVQAAAPQAVPLNVKMIMTAKNGQKLAVVDVGNDKASTERSLIIRPGDELPNEGGLVSDIRDNGVTVIFNNEEYKYDIAEIPKYNGIRKPGRKSKR